MIKRFIAVLTILFFLISTTGLALAEEKVNIYIDGKLLKTSVPSTVVSGNIYVPLKETFQALGASVAWQPATKTVYIVTGLRTMSLKPGSNKVSVYQGKDIILKAPASSIKGSITVPVSSITDLLDTRADVDISAKTVKAYSSGTFDYERVKFNTFFRVPIAAGINWIPVNALGKPKCLPEEIKALGTDPEKLQKNINTVYDAIQYIKLSGFKDAMDNIKVDVNGIRWEFHKNYLEALRTNCGGCADISSLVNFLLKDDYDEEGFIAYTVADGSGHVYNYFKRDGKYYFIDFTKQMNGFGGKGGYAFESGKMPEFNISDRVEGNVLEADSINDYVSYYQDTARFKPVIMEMYEAENSLVLGQSHEGDKLIDYLPKGSNVNIVYDVPDDNVEMRFTNPPTQRPTWP